MRREVRSLNRLGIDRFRAYLRKLRDGATLPAPVELLDDAGYSTELPVDIALEPLVMSDRLALGRHLVSLLEPLGAHIVDRDVGLWAWLSAALFDQVCPPDPDGRRRPGQDYRHVPDFSYRSRHRHLLLGPYQVYRRHGERSALLLSGPLHAESGIYHEIVSRRDLIANRGVIDAAVALYFDRKRGRPKAGAVSHAQPGTVRRFVRVLQQLDLTYDIYGLSARQLLELLPEEFDVWQPQHALDIGGGGVAAAACEDEASGGGGSGGESRKFVTARRRSQALRSRLRASSAASTPGARSKPAALDEVILSRADELARAFNARLSVVYCLAPLNEIARLEREGKRWSPEADQQMVAKVSNAISELLGKQGLDTEVARILRGPPGSELPLFVERENVDVLAMGALSRAALADLVIGTTAAEVLGRVDCDLLIVKPPGFLDTVAQHMRLEPAGSPSFYPF